MKNTLKSIGAIFAGIIVVFMLSHLTDLILEKTGTMKIPFSDNPLWLMVSVTIYRNVYVVIAGYVVATLAPGNQMKHIWTFAGIGFALGILGAVAMWEHPPHWYPVALIILGVPSAFLGGKLRVNKPGITA